MNFVLGKNCVAYVNATPVAPAGSTIANSDYATELALTGTKIVSNIKDLKLNFQTEKADISTRAGGGWKQTAATVKDGTITYTGVWKPSDAVFTIFLTAWLTSAEVFFSAIDGAYTVSGNQGPAGNFTVTNFSRSEGLNDAVTIDVELSPSSQSGWFTAA